MLDLVAAADDGGSGLARMVIATTMRLSMADCDWIRLEDAQKFAMNDLKVLPHADDRARRFFRRLRLDILPQVERCGVIIVTHLLPDRPVFLDALNEFAEIKAIIPKPKSVHTASRELIEKRFQIVDVNREALIDENRACEIFGQHAGSEPTVILDIGGYFAASAQAINERFTPNFLGVVEDTENG